MKDVCLKLKKKCIKPNQLIQGVNFFKDGDNGEFGNLTGISTDMNNPQVDNILWLTADASMQIEIDSSGTILMEGDTNITLAPNSEYYIIAYVYEAIDPPPVSSTDYFIEIDKTGWADAEFSTIQRYQLKPGTEGTWNKLVAKMVTGVNTIGKLKIVHSGTYIPFVDGEVFHIDTVSISDFIPYFGDVVTYKEQFTVPVEKNIDATLILKARDLANPSFFFQRSKTRTISIPSTIETEKAFGFSHDVGSIRGQKSFEAEYMAILEIDGMEILKGIFTFDELKTLNCNNNSYIGTLLSDNKVWMSLLESQNLCDIDWQEFNFLYSINNLQDNWTKNGDTSKFITHLFETREIPSISGNLYQLFATDFRMGIFMKPLITKIFRHIGYQVSFNGPFLNGTDFRDDLLTGITEGFFIESLVPDVVYFGYQTTTQVRIEEGETQFPDYDDLKFDPLSYISGNCVNKVVDFAFIMNLKFEIWSGTVYTSPEGTANFTLPAVSIYDGGNVCSRATFVLDTVAAASSDHAYWIRVELYQGVTIIDTQYIYDSSEPLWFTDNLTIISTTDLGNGDWRIDYEDSGANSFTHFFGASIMIGNGDTEFYTELRKAADPLDSGPIYGQNPACINLKTLMSNIAGLYNLISETNELTNTVELWQRDDYYALGADAVDTQEISTSGEVKQTRLSKKNSQDFIFSYQPNETDIWFEELAPDDFGNYNYSIDKGNAGLDDVEMSKDNILNATYDWEPLIDLWVPRYQQPSGEPARFGFRVLHYDGLTAITAPGQLEVTGNVPLVFPVELIDSYPRATFAARSGFGTTNLAFHDFEDNKGLVNKHFIDELKIISLSRILSVYFFLNADFIRKIDFSKFWKFKDSLFILNRVVDYNYIENQPTKVELVQLNTFYGTDDNC